MWNYGAIMRYKGVLRPGTIMNRAFHIGIGLTLAVHMVFGCCSHHAHGSRPASSPSVENSCDCDHHEHKPGGEPGNHRSGDQGCDGDQCVFTLPNSGNASQVTIGADCLPLIHVVPTLPGMNGIDTLDRTPPHCGSPIPLHLMNQALLL